MLIDELVSATSAVLLFLVVALMVATGHRPDFWRLAGQSEDMAVAARRLHRAMRGKRLGLLWG